MTSFKNIIYVFAPNTLAGAERVVLTGLSELCNLGFSPIIIIISESRSPQWAIDFKEALDPRVTHITISSTKAVDRALLTELKNCLNRYDNSIIHTHGYKALILSKLALNKSSSNKIVHTHHGNTSHTLKVKIYEWIAFQAMKKVAAVVAVSTQMKSLLIKHNIPETSISIIDNMLSLKNASSIRSELKIQKNQLNELIFIGRFSPEKGLLHFIKIFSGYKNKDLFNLTLLGDGIERVEIENIIKEKKLTNITFKGFVKNPDIYLSKADFLIMPSFTEGLPMTLIEASAVGLPVLANNVGAIHSLVQNNFNGILIEKNEAIDWTNALDKVCKEKESFKENAMNKSIKIETQYSANTWAKKTIDLYQSLLK
jgi:glycosyltransferase involved in cell wall biosynthesis